MSVAGDVLTVSTRELELFRAQGYLVLESLTTAEDLAQVELLFNRAFESVAAREDKMLLDYARPPEASGEMWLPQVIYLLDYVPELAKTLYFRNASSLCKQLLGSGAVFRGAHAMLKPAGRSVATAWHQDEAYAEPTEDHEAASVWLPLVDATLENGCMRFVPGSHRLEVLPHRHLHGDSRIHGLEIEPAVTDLTHAVACPVKRGGATVHHCRTLHFTGPNQTDAARPVVALEFGLPPKPRRTPRRFPWQEQTHESELDRYRRARGPRRPPPEEDHER
jgi:hypothetical protein